MRHECMYAYYTREGLRLHPFYAGHREAMIVKYQDLLIYMGGELRVVGHFLR